MAKLLFALSFLSLGSLTILYKAASDSSERLSPQGCRMSYMSPSYILQPNFDSTWTPLAKRYSLSLYREVGWQDNQPHGVPVLFIPGNAGSSRQVRSIASSAARQFYDAPYAVSSEFASRDVKPLDFYAVDYNEDLSAFHGPTLDAETRYAADATAYILSLYPPGTQIIVLGHSMGGVVATSLLSTLSPNISAIITMSTPHTIPPARFDRRISTIYSSAQSILAQADTPIVSICGGAADLMIPSESCILPTPVTDVYRRTVFSSALEGCWTGVGHQASVWCHQVRWRIARAALELGPKSTSQERGEVLDRWLPDGSSTPPPFSGGAALDLSTRPYQTVSPGGILTVRGPMGGQTHLFPAPADRQAHAFVLYLAGGTIHSLGPHHPSPLSATVHFCRGVTPHCERMQARTLKLLPDVPRGAPFPTPGVGVDETEGVAFFEAEVPFFQDAQPTWVAVDIAGGDGRGWTVGGFVEDVSVTAGYSVRDLLYGPARLPLTQHLRTRVELPHLLSHALLVYRVAPVASLSEACLSSLFPPLLEHTSPSETHFHPLALSAPNPNARPLLLHAHTSAPFLKGPSPGLHLTVHSSGECGVVALDLSIDWWATFGRMAIRYWAAIPGFAVGTILCMVFSAWSTSETGGARTVAARSTHD
ncbi:PGAP1-like protein-domain-containing protein [Amylostereum chailletii]|nr:PGAP1-like protein-domain-containing protein [Amylostereum chailletii]